MKKGPRHKMLNTHPCRKLGWLQAYICSHTINCVYHLDYKVLVLLYFESLPMSDMYITFEPLYKLKFTGCHYAQRLSNFREIGNTSIFWYCKLNFDEELFILVHGWIWKSVYGGQGRFMSNNKVAISMEFSTFSYSVA